MEDEKQGLDGAEGGGGVERSDARRMQDRRRYRLDEPFGVGAPLAGQGLREPLMPFAALLFALQRQEEMRDAARRAAEIVAAVESEREEPSPRCDWQMLWDEMEREAHVPKRGWEPEADGADPASPEANPEIGDWERHWPSHAERVRDCGSCDGCEGDGNDRRGPVDGRAGPRSIGLLGWLTRIFLAVFPSRRGR